MFQSCSPLLGLPRELRDQIYRYTAQEPGGYAHNATSGQLRTFEGAPIDFSLSYTCKQIYSEMRGMALKTNSITFTSQQDRSSDMQDSSITTRFTALLEAYYDALKTMLSWVSDCVTASHLDTLLTLHPYNSDVRKLQGMNEDGRLEFLRTYGLTVGSLTLRSIATIRALRDLLELVSEDERFYTLTAKEYDRTSRGCQIPPYHLEYYRETLPHKTEYDDSEHIPRYAPSSEKQLLAGILEPWWILDEVELDHLEKLLPDPWADQVFPNLVQRWYISAAAGAIQFLKRLSKDTRGCIRHILIIEDHDCETHHPSHSHGFIPYCVENPQLQVESEIDVWNVLFWHSRKHHRQEMSPYRVLLVTGQYLREALLLPQMGMPKGQYTLKLRGRTPEMTQQVWRKIKREAEVLAAARQLHQSHPEQQEHPLIRHTANYLPQVIQDVIDGDTPVLFDRWPGCAWDLEQATFDLKHTIPYEHEWRNVVDFSEFEQNNEEWEAMENEYMRKVD